MNHEFEIRDLQHDDESIGEAADLLVDAFGQRYAEWSKRETTEKYIRERISKPPDDRIDLVAVDGRGAVVGYTGGSNEGYEGYLWELDPLAVRRDWHRCGVGRALIARLEELVRGRGAIALWLGTDDWDGSTSIGGIDLYPDVIEHVARLSSLDDHPFRFYEKMGFIVVGALPDANGPGKPDILMAKRIAPVDFSQGSGGQWPKKPLPSESG